MMFKSPLQGLFSCSCNYNTEPLTTKWHRPCNRPLSTRSPLVFQNRTTPSLTLSKSSQDSPHLPPDLSTTYTCPTPDGGFSYMYIGSVDHSSLYTHLLSVTPQNTTPAYGFSLHTCLHSQAGLPSHLWQLQTPHLVDTPSFRRVQYSTFHTCIYPHVVTPATPAADPTLQTCS